MSSLAIAALAFATFGVGTALAGGDDMGGGGHNMGGKNKGKNVPTKVGAREIAVDATLPTFTPKEITVGAGEDVTIVLTSGDVFHDFVVRGKGHVVGAKANKTRKGGLRINKPGTYKFWCSVKDHRPAGMEGTIVVQ
jgi:heme/copper-type cytochrome/quinol oxidase subunit 2